MELVKVAITAVAAMEAERGAGYVHDIARAATVVSATAYYLTTAAYAELRARYAAAPVPLPAPKAVGAVDGPQRGDLRGLFFDRVVVINRDCRGDRLERVQRWWVDAGMADHPLARCRAVEGVKLPMPDWWRAGGPAWGCAQSHIRAIEWAIVENVQRLLILEDDVCFVPDFRAKLAYHLKELPPDWDQWYLGAQYLQYAGRPPWRINRATREIYNANRTHAYALSRQGMYKVYRWLTNYPQWRDYGNNFHIDHYLGVGHKQARWSVYGPTQWLCGQGGGISDLTYRDEASQFWDLGEDAVVDPSAVVVLGPFRSGTSLVGNLVSRLGAYPGTQLPVDREHNPDGFYEQRQIVDAYWAAFDPLSLEQKGPDAPLVAGLSDVRREAFARDARLYLVKYAHLVARPDLLHSVLGQQRHVFVSRRRADNIAAMRRSWWPDGDEAVRIHDAHMAASARVRGTAPYMDIAYEDVLSDPVGQTARLAAFLGLTRTEQQIRHVAAVVKPDRPWSAKKRTEQETHAN